MASATQNELTRLLILWQEGNSEALEHFASLVEPDLRRLAVGLLSKERTGHTLQPTALINEVFLRLLRDQKIEFQNRQHFFALAAKLMRRILVDHARKRNASKRGGGATLVAWSDVAEPAADSSVDDSSLDVLELEAALQRLESISPRQGRVVELRFFAGLTIRETAKILGVSSATIKVDWSMAQAFLYRELAGA